MSQITLHQLTKKFGPVTSVNKINLEIENGKIFAFVGPSGCGKTTTLRMIGGLEKPTSGEIRFDGRLANHVHPVDRNVAMVFQNFALYPHMTAKENMTLSLRVKKVDPAEIEKRLKRACGMLNIEHLLDRRPSQLSGGEKQRVAVGRAIIRDPYVLLMDEPLSNLDAKLRLTMRAELKKLIGELGVTTVYVTHDQVEAMTLADTIVVMNKGTIQQVDRPMNIYHHPSNLFVAGMVGSPPINLFYGKLEWEDGKPVFVSKNFCYSLEFWKGLEAWNGKNIIFGIRPNAVEIVADSDPRKVLSGTVEVLEQHGDEAFAHLSVGLERMMIKVDPSWETGIRETVHLSFQKSRVLLFDAETELRIGLGEEETGIVTLGASWG